MKKTKNEKLVPPVVFQKPDDLTMVEGESAKLLDLWEEEMAMIVGGLARPYFNDSLDELKLTSKTVTKKGVVFLDPD